MKKRIIFLCLTMAVLVLEVAMFLSCPLRGQASEPTLLTAIDILIEPEDALVRQAVDNNALLRKDYPKGFALDATHVPHISVLQCYVRTQDLDKIFAAVKRVTDAEKPFDMELETTGYFYAPWQGLGLAGITVAPAPQLLKYQDAILAAVKPFMAKNGTVAALVPNEDASPGDEVIAAYINTFASRQTGKNYNPHVTTGLASKEFLNTMIAASYAPFRFKVKSIGVYQLGDFGTARRRIWTLASA